MPELGKYAFAVLSSYGVTLGLIAGLIWMSWRRAKAARAALDAAEARRRGND